MSAGIRYTNGIIHDALEVLTTDDLLEIAIEVDFFRKFAGEELWLVFKNSLLDNMDRPWREAFEHARKVSFSVMVAECQQQQS